jgi:hypothetical protein
MELKRRGHARLCEYLFGFGKFLSRFRDRVFASVAWDQASLKLQTPSGEILV